MARKKPFRTKSKKSTELIGNALLQESISGSGRIRVEQALRESNTFLDSVIENIPHMIFVKDAKELRFVRFNRAGEDLVGFPKKLMIGKNDFDFFPQKEADFFTKKDREVLKKGRLFDIPEESIHTRRKGIRILHTKKIPIRNSSGVPVYLLGISEDITDRLRLEREIAAISDREQKRLGQDLHDGLGQDLTGVAFLIKGLAQRLAKKKIPEAAEAGKIAGLVNQAIAMTRNLARVLNPIDLESGGLAVAFRQLAKNTEKLFDIGCVFDSQASLRFLDSNKAVNLFRIAQEAVDNAVKHGQATRIQIRCLKIRGKFRLLIQDNGSGIPSRFDYNQGMGINNMRYRAKNIKGHLTINRRRAGGVVVQCDLSEG